MDLQDSILKTILYFDVFDYPLTKKDLQDYLSMECKDFELAEALNIMVGNKLLFVFENKYYSIHNDATLINKRKSSNDLSKSLEPLAQKNALLISKFPFVRSVCISGSMSKGVMFEDSDIDYFIICKTNRVWLGRAFLVLYKRLFLNNSKEHFCINFFMSENDLKIREENIFTATELQSLLGVTGKAYYQKLLQSNTWVNSFIKNFPTRDEEFVEVPKPYFLSRIIEFAMDGRLGDLLEKRIMKIFHNRNVKKYAAELSDERFELMYRSDNTQAKVHSGGHQAKVLHLYGQKIKNHNLSKISQNG